MQLNVMPSFLIYFLSCVISYVFCEHNEGDGHYMNEWALEIPGGESAARRVADRHGMDLVGAIGSLPNHFRFRHRRIAKRSADSADEHHFRLSRDVEVSWTEQQRVRQRAKRDLLDDDDEGPGRRRRRSSSRGRRAAIGTREDEVKSEGFRDPLWDQQWYLHNGGIGRSDMKVREAWQQGITGKGVVVTILDDGIEHNHPDLQKNYNKNASKDINGGDPDPMPRYDPYNENKHGTRCAGEVAAVADNDVCMVGVAFNAGIGGVRMLDGEVNDAIEAESLSHAPNEVDIYSASWGPDDNGQVVDGPGTLARKAFELGVTHGRGGKGNIFVWASGNGGRDKDSCACDGYTNSIYTLSVSSASQNGRKPWYLEECASTLTTTYSSGNSREQQIVSTDLHGKCTTEHTGTSASAPLAAGLCALALEANPSLTWRDMQHIVVLTSNPAPLFAGARDWTTNGVGRNVSHIFGFGLMDAGAMVTLAKKWTPVPDQEVFIGHYAQNVVEIPSRGDLSLDVVIDTRGQIGFLEHVQAEVTLSYHPRGKLTILLTSPMGTRSTLLPLRPRDTKAKLMAWKFLTVHCWGEDPKGKWTLTISHDGSSSRGKMTSWRLILYGTKIDPTLSSKGGKNGRHIVMEDDVHHVKVRGDAAFATNSTNGPSTPTLSSSAPPIPSCHSQCLDRCHDNTSSGCYRCKNVRLGDRGPCVEFCGVHSYIRNETVEGGEVIRTCERCHSSCASCSGPKDTDCLQCPESSFLENGQCKDDGRGFSFESDDLGRMLEMSENREEPLQYAIDQGKKRKERERVSRQDQ